MAIEPIKWPAAAGWKQILVRTWKESGDDDVGLLAAGVAFYFFLAFVPLLASIVLTYGLIADPVTVSEHIRTLAQTLPREAAAIIGDQLKAITGEKSGGHGFGLLLAIGLAVYGASKGAGAIVKALNIAYEVKETRGFVKTLLLSLAITLGLMAMIAAATLAASVMSFVEHLLPFSSPVVHVALQIVSALLAVAVVGVGIALLYRYAPNRPDAPWAWVTPGSAVATILWVAASFGFGVYVSNFGNYNATYGSLGGVVVFLTWLYITSFVLLMGGELNSELERQQAEEVKAAEKPLAAKAPPLEGWDATQDRPGDGPASQGLGRGGVSGKAPRVIDATPTQPWTAAKAASGGSSQAVHPLKGEGLRTAGAVALLAGAGALLFKRNRKRGSDEVFFTYPKVD